MLCLNDIQLTAENVEGAVQSLSDTIVKSENNEAEQNDEVLSSVADYFTQLKVFLTQPNATITNTVCMKATSSLSLSLTLSFVSVLP